MAGASLAHFPYNGARSKQRQIPNGLVKWNPQREETDVWEVSKLRSARSLENKHSAVTRERIG